LGGVELVHDLHELVSWVARRNSARRSRDDSGGIRGRGRRGRVARPGNRRQISGFADLGNCVAIDPLHVGLDFREGHGFCCVAAERDLPLHGRLHRVGAAREHPVEHVRAHLELHVGRAVGRPDPADQATPREAEMDFQVEVDDDEME